MATVSSSLPSAVDSAYNASSISSVLALSMVTKSRAVRSRRVSPSSSISVATPSGASFSRLWRARGYPPWDEVVVAKSDELGQLRVKSAVAF